MEAAEDAECQRFTGPEIQSAHLEDLKRKPSGELKKRLKTGRDGGMPSCRRIALGNICHKTFLPWIEQVYPPVQGNTLAELVERLIVRTRECHALPRPI
jgi:hypothetical protein